MCYTHTAVMKRGFALSLYMTTKALIGFPTETDFFKKFLKIVNFDRILAEFTVLRSL